MSVHPGARAVLTRAVERESATETEANAATEVVMPLETLRFVDRSDEVVIGTPEREVKARTVHRIPAGQREDADTRKVSKAYRGSRIHPRRLKVSL